MGLGVVLDVWGFRVLRVCLYWGGGVAVVGGPAAAGFSDLAEVMVSVDGQDNVLGRTNHLVAGEVFQVDAEMRERFDFLVADCVDGCAAGVQAAAVGEDCCDGVFGYGALVHPRASVGGDDEGE